MFKSVESLLKGIAKRENNIEQQDKEIQLLKPLLNYLIDVRMEVARTQQEIPQYVKLYVEDWKDQYKGGINRCCGFDILWSSKNV